VPERASALVTVLFTDLVGSTELLSRAGDDDAQRIFRAHHDLLAETAAVHGGEEVKWLGDGLMVVFASVADALSAAIAMQQAARRPVAGEHLSIRVGLNAGEALRDATDYFGTTVVVARRLCDRAEGGQILCADVVAMLLGGRPGFAFSELGKLELKGVPAPVGALELRYETDVAHGLPARVPFVGRESELEHLAGQLAETAVGRGGLVMVVGDPGIGKTRTAEELSERARRQGMNVVWGHCYEGDWAPPYGPFVELLEAIVGSTEPGELRADLGDGGAPLARLVPGLRQVLPDLPEAVPLQSDEERFRLLDAMAQFLVGRSRRAPLVCCLDDLHWVDKASVAMLRHVARFAVGQRLLLLGTYRDAEVGPGHPLAEALGALRRDVEYERVKLEGLESKAVAELLDALAEHDVTGAVATAVTAETDGNPFFIKEVLRYLIEEGRFFQGPDGRWASDRPIAELGIPDGVREVIERRLSRLSGDANRLLGAASLFEGNFRFDVVAQVSGLDEAPALDALDEALSAQLLAPAGGIDTYGFTHALVRHTLSDGLSPSRRGRLHLRVAEALAAAAGAVPTAGQAGEIAGQYHRAAGLAGAERGVDPALAAAAHAEANGAHDEAARFLRTALELLPEGDGRRARLLGRLGMALAWALAFDEAVRTVAEAGDLIAATEGRPAATEYLSDAAYACAMAGGVVHAWDVARTGLTYAGARDVAWARLVSFDLERRAAEDPDHPGVPHDSSERRESARILRAARLDPLGPGPMEAVFDSRAEALESSNVAVLYYWAGEFARSLPLIEAEAQEAESLGRLARAARAYAFACCGQMALGDLDAARRSEQRARDLVSRVGTPTFVSVYVQTALALALDDGWEELASAVAPLIGLEHPALAWGSGMLRSIAAGAAAHCGRTEEAIAIITGLVPWLEHAPAWTVNFNLTVGNAVDVLWVSERLDHVEVIEQALREKVIVPDFRSPMVDGRLALARLCALTGRHDEAVSWFTAAREALAEQGARPLLAICDYDEALMYARRGDPGDAALARPLLDAARRQFEAIGMTGWIPRAERLSERLG
jgi:class 3 adenylate cyclase/tetratricopeptide (TPR) repeat protein